MLKSMCLNRIFLALAGEEDRTSLTKTVKDSLRISVIINVIIAVLVIVGADFLAVLFRELSIMSKALYFLL